MGQQQLLLVILVTVIVGIMTVVAINVFSDARDEGLKDTIRQELLEAATVGQGFYMRHESMGGGGNSFQNITLPILGLSDSSVVSTYQVQNVTDDSFEILADPLSNLDDLIIVVYSDRVEWREE